MIRSPARRGEESMEALRRSALETSRSIQTLHRQAELELIEAKRALERRADELSESLALVNAILESSPNGIVALDLTPRIVAWNQRYLSLWNVPQDILARRDGVALTRHVAGQVRNAEAFARRVEDLRSRPEADHFDTVELLDGRTFERYVSPQRVAGRCIGTIVNWHDVTERRVAEALRLAKEVAEAANLSKSAFLSRMSHELRTPLNAIVGFSEVLHLGGPQALLPDQLQHVERIRRAGSHLLSLIEDVLDVSRIESGSMQIYMEEVDVLDAVREASRNVKLLADTMGVSLSIQADPLAQALRVIADRTRLQQVLLNLMSNAIKYNRAGGTVVVRVEPGAERLAVHVCDTGLGMDEQQMRELFQPFNRLGRESSEVQGTGIGLVITRKLVELMGSSLTVASQPGRGSEFSFDLALPGAAVHEPERVREFAGPSLRAEVAGQVLYIDDDEVNRLLMQAFFSLRPGVDLHVEADGQTGIEAACRLLPRLILIDMRLTDMSGIDVLKAVRAQPALAKTPCIAVSANAMPEEIAEATQAGFDAYVTKPISAVLLFAEVDRFLD